MEGTGPWHCLPVTKARGVKAINRHQEKWWGGPEGILRMESEGRG